MNDVRPGLALRIQSKYKRTLADIAHRRPVRMANSVPYISFTFDDFPRSAVNTAGRILEEAGARGTYYASFGLMGTTAPTGSIFVASDVERLLAAGHELGCHTFQHLDSWEASAREFDESIARNEAALADLAPGARFTSFSYPISVPNPGVKRVAATHFEVCRCGGQAFNAGSMDRNLLKAFFIEKKRDDLPAIARIIEDNARQKGWLIFATHDIDESPTPYGCTPEVFRQIVDMSVASGARILPVAEAMREICEPSTASSRAAG